jgi:hypothetical protein
VSAVEEPGRAGDARLAWAYRAAIVLAFVGVFGTWRSSGPVSLNGFEGPHNGWEVIIFGLIALIGVGATARGSWPGIVLVLGCGVVMAYGALSSVVDGGDLIGGSTGWGVWLSAAASVLLAIVAVVAAVGRVSGRKPSELLGAIHLR